LGAAYKTPFRTTGEIQARWDKEGPSLLILRNQVAQRTAQGSAKEAAKP
jgi:hypothetical protein